MSTLLDLDDPKLTDEVRRRLRSILRDYACRPTSEGWRKLALMLLSQQHSGLQSMKEQLSGTKNYGALLWMHMLLRDKPEMKAVTAANTVAKQLNADKKRSRKVRSKTLQNQFAKLKDRESSELQLKPLPALQRYEALWNALTSAAIQLEQSYEDEPHYDEPYHDVK
jgi:hypothetical protein